MLQGCRKPGSTGSEDKLCIRACLAIYTSHLIVPFRYDTRHLLAHTWHTGSAQLSAGVLRFNSTTSRPGTFRRRSLFTLLHVGVHAAVHVVCHEHLHLGTMMRMVEDWTTQDIQK